MFAHRQALDAVGDRTHEGGEWRRGVIRIDRREPAAHIQAIQYDAGFDNELTNLSQCQDESVRGCGLRADVEGDAQGLSRLPGLSKQPHRPDSGEAVLTLERDLAVLRRYSDPHPQSEVAAAAGLFGDFFELIFAVERKTAYPELRKCAPN